MKSEAIKNSKTTHRNAYRISALIATLVFAVCVYICTIPGMYPRDQFLLFAAAATMLIASLIVGSWGLKKAPPAKWPLDPLIGLVVLLEIAECLFGLIKVAPAVFH